MNWYCCPDDMYCVTTTTVSDCPFFAAKALLVKMAAKKQCEGTDCPTGCCPEVNWTIYIIVASALDNILSDRRFCRQFKIVAVLDKGWPTLKKMRSIE